MEDNISENKQKDVKGGPIIIVGLLILVGIVFSLFNKKTPVSSQLVAETPQPTANLPQDMSQDNTGVPTSSVREFTVNGTNFKFDLTNITVNKGDKVKINFMNKEGKHDFVLDEFGVATKILNAESSETVEFVADKVGTFEYYCSVGEHRAMGMVGSMVVK